MTPPPPARSPLAAIADAYDPPEVERHEGWASPSAFAASCSRGQWRPARHLQVIEDAVLQGIEEGRIVVVEVPIRHGKSIYCSTWLPAWYLGRNPDKRVILGTQGSRLAERWGRDARQILKDYGPTVFGVKVSPVSGAAGRWDIEGHKGGMLSLGVGGGVVGWGGDLIIVDDPYGGFLDAMSPTIRENVIDWWIGSLRSRLEPGGAVVILCARWHEDDLPGFLLREGRNVIEVRMPGLCDDEATDPLGRRLGEPLWPERWSAAELDELHHDMTRRHGEAVWLAQVQQTPQTPTGGMFRPDCWETLDHFTVDVRQAGRWVRGWDLAASYGRGDWTVGVLLGEMPNGSFVVADVVRGRWDPAEVRAMVRSTADTDPAGTVVALPQDPAQAGKDQADQYRQLLAPHRVVQRTFAGQSKETRAAGYSSQHLASRVALVQADWTEAFVAEHTAFPQGAHDDQVDAAAEAYNVLVGGAAKTATVTRYDTGGWSAARR